MADLHKALFRAIHDTVIDVKMIQKKIIANRLKMVMKCNIKIGQNVEAWTDPNEYQILKRAAEYPSKVDQLDDLYIKLVRWLERQQIKAVKINIQKVNHGIWRSWNITIQDKSQ